MPASTANLFETQVCAHLRQFRGRPVVLDSDLAWFLGVPTELLIEAVEQHPEAFPEDFVLPLSPAERAGLCRNAACLTQSLSASCDTGGLAFTTHGAQMLVVVLRDEAFALAAIPVFRAFARFWEGAVPADLAPQGRARKS